MLLLHKHFKNVCWTTIAFHLMGNIPFTLTKWALGSKLFFCLFNFKLDRSLHRQIAVCSWRSLSYYNSKDISLPDGLVQMCPKPVTNQKKVKDHVISVLDPLSSHVYCHPKVRLQKKKIRLMSKAGCVSGKWEREQAPVFSSLKLSRFRPVTLSFSKVHCF